MSQERGGQAREERLRAGRVGRPHGLDGSFYVTRPLVRLLVHGSEVSVGGHTRTILRRAGTDRNPIVRLEGIATREQAQALRGAELEVERSSAPVLQEGEWWAHELEGCEVDGGGRVIGHVRRLLELPSCEVLEVQRSGREDLLVPLVADAIVSVEIQRRRIEVNLDFLDAQDGA